MSVNCRGYLFILPYGVLAMTMLSALSLLAAIATGLALFVFNYFFTRYMGNHDTEYFADVMSQIRESEPQLQVVKAKSASA